MDRQKTVEIMKRLLMSGEYVCIGVPIEDI